MDGAALRRFDLGSSSEPSSSPAAPLDEEAPEPARAWPESELEFYTRRAVEERRLATIAPTPAAKAAHLYLAASYSAKLAQELAKELELEQLALRVR